MIMMRKIFTYLHCFASKFKTFYFREIQLVNQMPLHRMYNKLKPLPDLNTEVLKTTAVKTIAYTLLLLNPTGISYIIQFFFV